MPEDKRYPIAPEFSYKIGEFDEQIGKYEVIVIAKFMSGKFSREGVTVTKLKIDENDLDFSKKPLISIRGGLVAFPPIKLKPGNYFLLISGKNRDGNLFNFPDTLQITKPKAVKFEYEVKQEGEDLIVSFFPLDRFENYVDWVIRISSLDFFAVLDELEEDKKKKTICDRGLTCDVPISSKGKAIRILCPGAPWKGKATLFGTSFSVPLEIKAEEKAEEGEIEIEEKTSIDTIEVLEEEEKKIAELTEIETGRERRKNRNKYWLIFGAFALIFMFFVKLISSCS